ncbi:MAG TPA: TetR family transcriptional regulator [Acidimicrobiales bacterium]|jgi:AcrR family transcriptional regulator|nr:TetR family transcriptional regulator [Acidimicrobiales bacterium]
MVTSTTGRRGPGRRPGNPDTRAHIVAAARRVFRAEGYDAASSRSIAREAGVDPALIHHYFESKAALFMAALDFPLDPRRIREALDPDLPKGEQLVLMFLHLWEGGLDVGDDTASPADPDAHPFITVVQAATSGPAAGAALREFLKERVWTNPAMAGERPTDIGEAHDDHPDRALSPEQGDLRHGLVSSQLFGIGWARYVLKVEPLASATPEAIAKVVGPTIERYMSGDLGDVTALGGSVGAGGAGSG